MSEAERQGVQAEHIIAAPGDPIPAGALCFDSWQAKHGFKHPVGFAFANDLLATGAQIKALEHGWRMPEDMLMLGFGDFPVGRYCQGGLSTMHIDGEQIGKACARYIARSLQANNKPSSESTPHEQYFIPQLLWRGASAPALS